MKIIYLAPSIIPSRAANSIHVVKMMQAFIQLGHEVELIVPDKKKEREKGVKNVFEYYGVNPFKFTYFPYRRFPGSLYLYSFLLGLWVKFKHKDIVYSRDFYPAVFAALFGSKTIMEFHEPPRTGRGIRGWLIKRFYASKQLIKLVVISDALKQIFLSNRFKEEQLTVAHDGSDPVPENLPDFPLEGNVKAGYVGHLYKGRGIEHIIYLAEKNNSVDFHIAGGNEQDILEWKQKTETMHNLHFHGFIEPSKTDSFRAACDFLLAPYQKELTIWGNGKNTSSFMSPLKIFEYMASGKIILCSNLPVLREILDETNSLLIEPDNLEAWDFVLKKVNDTMEASKKLGIKAKSDFLLMYTWNKRAKHILEAIAV